MADFSFLDAAASDVAPKLLGCILERRLDGRTVRGKIVETEAYDQTDAASHSYKGRTPSNEILFGDYGHLYVYFTYGMHYCCNVVVEPPGKGAAVLIRAVEPLGHKELLSKRRHGLSGVNLTNGPAKLCQALDIDKRLNGQDLQESPLKLIPQAALADDLIVQTTRIGISQAKDVPWRFYIRDNPFVSKI